MEEASGDDDDAATTTAAAVRVLAVATGVRGSAHLAVDRLFAAVVLDVLVVLVAPIAT